MKKILYGTTALVAAGLVAGQASAASGIKLSLGGFYRGAMGFLVDQSNNSESFPGADDEESGNGRNAVNFREEIRINFKGETTLDNGITVGVLIGVNAEKSNLHDAHISFSGKFGDLRFGEQNSALISSCVVDPGNVTANFGVNSSNESFSNAGLAGISSEGPNDSGGFGGNHQLLIPFQSVGTCFGNEAVSKSTKLLYFSPTFGGFSFAVSYSPQETRLAGGQSNAGTPFESFNERNIVSVAVNFNHDFGGVTLTAGGGGEWALTSDTTSDKPAFYQAGFQVGFGQFAVGASGALYQNYTWGGFFSSTASGPGNIASSSDAWVASVGGSWTQDAISIGLQGIYGHYELNGFGADQSDKLWGVSLNSAYALGPGISLEGQVAYTKYDANSTSSYNTDYHAIEVDLGTAISF